jgi:hypothetical protein
MSTSTPKPLSTEEMEAIMKQIEVDDGPAVPAVSVQPNATPTPIAPAGSLPTGNPLQLREFVDPEQLKRDVEFSVHNLDEAVQNHASTFVHYANNARLARRQFERMKAAFDILESRLEAHYRLMAKSTGEKATDKSIEAQVKGDPRWWAGQTKLIDAKAIYELANDARAAFDHRRDMIVQVSVDRRKEREGELRFNAVREGREAALLAEQSRRAATARKRPGVACESKSFLSYNRRCKGCFSPCEPTTH